jgi:hypothetical protein
MCPKCFGDIPGEEAATDPGDDVKAAQARRDHARSAKRAVLPLLLATPLVGLLAVAAVWFALLRPVPEVVLLDFDEFDDYPMPELVAEAAPVPDKPIAPTAGPTSPKPEPTPGFKSDHDLGLDDAVADLGDDAAVATNGDLRARDVSTGPSAGPRDIQAAKAPSSQAGLDFGLDVTATRRGAILEDSEAIRKMIGDRMRAQAPRLNACYESQLKSDESLAGRWRLAFTVTKAGKVASASAEGVTASVPEFEACLASEVGGWSFQRIKSDQPVRKSFTFRPAG